MDGAKRSKKSHYYLGVDVGGTKILATLVEESGTVLARERITTPRDEGAERVVVAIEKAMEKVLLDAAPGTELLTAIGVAVPGVVDPETARVIVTPNMNLTGVALGSHLEARFKVPVVLGNDCNLGALGEAWLGSARQASSAIVILVGTGIGSGIVRKGKLWRGARESAGEIGHIVMQIGGPKCGCGNQGCLEALASRTAIERDLRQAVAAGRKTALSGLLQGDLSLIRSSALRKALESEDELVTEVMRRASEVLGYACLTVRHLLDPEVIVLGGGVVEACSQFMLPIVEHIVGCDQLPGAREGGQVRLSALGDDAVVLGCVALARRHVGRSPFKKRYNVQPAYPVISQAKFGEVTVDQKTYGRDISIDVDGQVKKRDLGKLQQRYGNVHRVGWKELERLCKGGPEVLLVGTGIKGQLELSEDGQRFLSRRSIQWKLLSTAELVAAYNSEKARKVALIHLGSAEE
jgi:glucokinase